MPVAVLPVFLLLRIKSIMRNYYLFVSIFTNQLFLVFFFKEINPQDNLGNGIFKNLSILYSSALPLSIILLTRLKNDQFTMKKNMNLSEELLKFSWISFFGLGLLSASLAKTKLMPISTTVMFGIVLFLILAGDFEYEKLIITIYRMFGVISAGLTISFIFKFDWNNYSSRTLDPFNLDQNVYYSPLARIFDFNPRSFGFLGGPQVAGVFSVIGVACYLASSAKKKNPLLLISLILFGSCSGSRTYYVTLICLIFFSFIRKFLPREKIAQLIFMILGLVSVAAMLYKWFLPIISTENGSLTNLTGRAKLWEYIIRNWSNQGLLGHGPNTLTNATQSDLYYGFAHAHNSFLQALWDFGLLGIFTVLMIVLTSIVKILGDSTEGNRLLLIIVTLMCIQTEPMLVVGTGTTTWFWLIPLVFAFSKKELKL